MTTKGLLLTLLCYINLIYGEPQYQQEFLSIWNTAKPGELLKSLDAVTSSNQPLIQTAQPEQEIATENNDNLEKIRLQRRADEESAESLEEKLPYNYDRAYEEFVKKYFDDSVTDAFSASDSEEDNKGEHDAETYSGEEVESSELDEPITEASKKLAKSEKCKKVERGKQNCLICKNPRNGETSESCSFNKETKPQSFAFEKQKNFRKYRATPKNNDKEDSNEQIKIAKTSASVKKPIVRLPANNKSNHTTICTMNKLKNKTCYHCENDKGEKLINCYNEEMQSTEDESKKQPKKKLQKSHQRIYKRTISYSYENIPKLDDNTNTDNNDTDALEKPLIQKHFLIKEFNENDR